ncbi:MAG: UDP-N-acetylmuramate--alanine ligase [Erysipelotrichia bacterium]|nr:UDP-N-acetylmuramate--alanine ligase [Erysipelotrichia bacterium]
MASLACILKDQKEEVAGSDIDKYIFIQESLVAKNIPIYSFNAENIKDGMKVIIGNAFDESNVEVKAALSNPNVTTYTYPQFLGYLVERYHSICVCGTHGKTGTTGMLAHVFENNAPTGYLIGDGTGYMPQNAKNFILEACEYQRHFLAYYPDYILLLNIELDHVDYYKDIDDYLNAFETFANQAKKGVAVFGDDQRSHQIQIKVDHLFYGLDEKNDVYAKNVVEDEQGVSFDCYYHNELFGKFHFELYGKHLLWNTLGVITIGIMNGMSAKMLQTSIASFHGVKRRFNIEENKENIYIDDYAHHPTAIGCTIAAAKQKYPNHRLIAVFKPDRYSRIQYFLDEFKDAFKEADQVFLCHFPENAVREEGISVSIEDLKERIPNAEIIAEDERAGKYLASLGPAVYLFMSSKDIYNLKNKVKIFQ